jgi:hypothetical protein
MTKPDDASRRAPLTKNELRTLREKVRPARPEDRLPEGTTVVTFFRHLKRPGGSKT